MVWSFFLQDLLETGILVRILWFSQMELSHTKSAYFSIKNSRAFFKIAKCMTKSALGDLTAMDKNNFDYPKIQSDANFTRPNLT